MPRKRAARGNGSTGSGSSSLVPSAGDDSLNQRIAELRATAARVRQLPEDPAVGPLTPSQFHTLTFHLLEHLSNFDLFEGRQEYIRQSNTFQSDVLDAIHTVVNGVHGLRGMTLETLDFLMQAVDLYANRPPGQLDWQFSRHIALFLMRLNPTYPLAVQFMPSLSNPLWVILFEFIRADRLRGGDLAELQAPPLYSGDMASLAEDGYSTESFDSIPSSIGGPVPKFPIEEAVERLLPDIPEIQLTAALADRYTGETGASGVPCAICQEDTELQTSVTQLPCGHIFHTKCIAHAWYYRDSEGEIRPCPCCRHDCGSLLNNAQSKKRSGASFSDEELPPARKRAMLPVTEGTSDAEMPESLPIGPRKRAKASAPARKRAKRPQ